MALLALLLWPLLVPPILARRGMAVAVSVLVVAGYLLLPERVSVPIPALPDYDKTVAISLAALIGAVLATRQAGHRRQRKAVPAPRAGGDRILRAALIFCTVLLIVGPVLTWRTNQFPLVFGPTVLPSLSFYDAGSMILGNLVFFAPFALGYLYLTSAADHRTLLKVIFGAGILYAVLAAIEIRLSPQLNVWVYGFFPHSFLQHMRGDGFRPLVFLQHGLWLGFFLLTVILSGLALTRIESASMRGKVWLGVIWVVAVFAISKNLGAMLLLFAFGPLVLLGSLLLQIRAAAIVITLFLCYPALWQSGLMPKDWFVDRIASISVERAQSFQFRLDNEEQLVARAMEKPLTGWGGWGRNRVYDDRGQDLSVTDGLWIIELGSNGWVGYIGLFGLFCFPILVMARRRNVNGIDRSTAVLCIIVAANCVYLVPNSALSPIGWLVAGAVAGRLRSNSMQVEGPNMETAHQDGRSQTRYTRFDRASASKVSSRARLDSLEEVGSVRYRTGRTSMS